MEFNTYRPNLNLSGAMELNTTTFNGSTWGAKEVIPVVVLGLCAVVGLPSNIAVIIAIVRNIIGQNMSFTLKLMLSLSVCDTLSLLTIPVWIYALLKGWSLGDWWCKLFSYLVYWSLYASVLIVTSMSVHHHNIMKAKRPNRQLMERLQRRRKHVWLAALWVVAGLLALPIIPTRGVVAKIGGLRCQKVDGKWQKVSVLLYEVLFGFAIPFSVLVTSYLCLYKKVPKANLLSKQRMTRLVVSIVVVFFLFWMPTHIINIVDIVAILTKNSNHDKYKQAKHVRRMAGDFAKTLSYMNCCLDPFLYAFASRSFLARLRRSTKRERVQSSSQQATQDKTSKAESIMETQT
ncbi:leukotriene B4 receptor 1-like [Alosa sapidissima]|uniref:leukotriene B4 receptor 1-like n=1 Tax=Alosa sapidissima TaxID=34773 RepID=UPI001C09C42D|nr:leukotriene B4 receptor 1-like [Alosa sapidissima]XP_041964769.1 leukotriene B4 receptor 1-like [Alosa sapidissima]